MRVIALMLVASCAHPRGAPVLVIAQPAPASLAPMAPPEATTSGGLVPLWQHARGAYAHALAGKTLFVAAAGGADLDAIDLEDGALRSVKLEGTWARLYRIDGGGAVAVTDRAVTSLDPALATRWRRAQSPPSAVAGAGDVVAIAGPSSFRLLERGEERLSLPLPVRHVARALSRFLAWSDRAWFLIDDKGAVSAKLEQNIEELLPHARGFFVCADEGVTSFDDQGRELARFAAPAACRDLVAGDGALYAITPRHEARIDAAGEVSALTSSGAVRWTWRGPVARGAKPYADGLLVPSPGGILHALGARGALAWSYGVGRVDDLEVEGDIVVTVSHAHLRAFRLTRAPEPPLVTSFTVNVHARDCVELESALMFIGDDTARAVTSDRLVADVRGRGTAVLSVLPWADVSLAGGPRSSGALEVELDGRARELSIDLDGCPDD